MEFSTAADVLQEALKVVSGLAPPTNGNITLTSTGKKVYIAASSDSAMCTINMPAAVRGKPGKFAISLLALKDATKGRKELTLLYDKTLCKISGASYKCELPTVDAIDSDDTEEKLDKSVSLDVDQVTWLKSAVAVVALKPTPLLATFMPVAIKLSEKGAFIACYDENHMAFMRSKEIKGSMELKIPLEVLTAVFTNLGKTGLNIALSKSGMTVSNKLVKLNLNLPQEEETDLKLSEVLQTAQASVATGKTNGIAIELDKAEVQSFMDNARSVATKERSEVRMEFAKDKLKLEVSTANGMVRTVVKAKCGQSVTALIDFDFFDEAIRKSGATVALSLVKSEFMVFDLAKGSVVISLNQGA